MTHLKINLKTIFVNLGPGLTLCFLTPKVGRTMNSILIQSPLKATLLPY